MPSRIWFFCSSIDSGTFPFFHIVGSLIKLQIRVFAIADTLTIGCKRIRDASRYTSKKISLKLLFLSDIFLFPFIRQQVTVLA